METIHSAEIPAGIMTRLTRLPVLRQFIKFCLVGATSTSITLGVFRLLMWLGGPHVGTDYAMFANTAGFCLAVTNGFIWNRLWTFRGQHQRGTRTQYVLFVLVNLVGLAICNTIVFITLHLLHGSGVSKVNAGTIGELLSLPIVAVWNFSANKRWTFAAPSDPE